MATRDGGSRYLKEPFDCTHVQRFETTERVMELQFEAVDKRLARIEALIEAFEKRLWMTIYGVVGVVLTQAVVTILDLAPK